MLRIDISRRNLWQGSCNYLLRTKKQSIAAVQKAGKYKEQRKFSED
jgi:hypothetical protein